MKGMLTVLRFTFCDQGRKKSYIISTVIMVILVVAALSVPAIVNFVKGGGQGGTGASSQGGGEAAYASSTLYVIDHAGVISDAAALESALPGYRVTMAQDADRQRLVADIKDNGKMALAVLGAKDGALYYDYYVKSPGEGPDPGTLGEVFKNLNATRLLAQNGLSGTEITKVLSNVAYNLHPQGKGMLTGYLPAIAVSLLLFMTIYMYGYWVAMSIASEKTSRVMELLITSTSPSKIVVGKSIAMGLLGLIQMLCVILAAVVTYKAAYPENFNLGGLSIDFSAFTLPYAVMLVAYFIFGFALYAMINAVAGATVSNADDVRTAIMPVSFIAVIAFYFAYGTIMVPNSNAAVAASLVPFSAPFSMPSRFLMANVPVWQLVLSFALLIATTVLMTAVSIRLYSAAVLHYGGKLKISDLIRISKAG